MRRVFTIALWLAASAGASAQAEPSLEGIDPLIEAAMKEWNVPGLAVAVVKDDRVVLLKGYGLRDVERKLPVTPQTLFAIGSITKSFTVTGLGILVDEGKLDWDRPVRDVLADFQLKDPIATDHATARDLVSHRTGLPRHDYVWYADPGVSRAELLRRLRHLEPAKEFRAVYQYQNLMFMTAGIMIERISGTSWEEFTRRRIVEPLEMERTNFSVEASQKADDVALPYARGADGPRRIPFHNIDAIGPAGSINSNVEAMSRYVRFHINRGTLSQKRILSNETATQMQTPQVVMPDAGQGEEFGPMSYGLGLMIGSYRGEPTVEHSGSIDGFVAQLSLLPRRKIGIVVLTNLARPNPLPPLVARSVFDRLLGLEPVDWAERAREQDRKSAAAREEARRKRAADRREGTTPSHAMADYVGRYEHPAYGVVTIEADGTGLKLSTGGGLSAPLRHYHYDVFETAEDPTGRLERRKASFSYDAKGRIDRVAIGFEPAVADIVFTRTADPAPRLAAAGWTPELMMEMGRVGHVRPSPDGKRVVYTVTRAVIAEEQSESVTQIFLTDAEGDATVQLTHGDKSSTDPQWSPDGASIAFLSERAGKNNLYRLSLSGGEAEPLTASASPVVAFAWSPDGKRIAFTMAEAAPDASKRKEDWRWVDEDFRMNRLYVMSLDGKREPRALTGPRMHVAGGTRSSAAEMDWSPDGASIVFSHRRSPRADDWTTSDISRVDVATGAVTPIAATPAAEFGAIFSPDGKSIAFLASDRPPTWAGAYAIRIVASSGGEARTLPATPDQQPGLVGWSVDGAHLFFTEARGTLTRVGRIDVAKGSFAEIQEGDALIRSLELNRARTMFGFVSEAPDRAPEAFVSPVEPMKPTAVSRVNSERALPPLGKSELVRWKAADGLEIEGLLTLPVGYAEGTRVPLLLQIHGGPAGVFMQNYEASPSVYPNAVFASRGFAILRPNPRGSSGYGKAFRYANLKDWGGGDYRDLMAGVDHVIARGVADPERLGVMGWSYGGYMTSWTITQTRRFKAASVGAAVTNLVSFTGTADIPGFLPDYLGSQPWESSELYRARSAVFNAAGVTTPTLIQHGEADLRVPISQGYEFYNAIKQQGVPVRMIVFPRQAHGLTEPKMLLQAMRTNLEWFERYLKP
jgi:dipeptidyl aminopeptidase/acylaminoacyl peptidase/CubicO group peptidase (beta-lactamase class C family)